MRVATVKEKFGALTARGARASVTGAPFTIKSPFAANSAQVFREPKPWLKSSCSGLNGYFFRQDLRLVDALI